MGSLIASTSSGLILVFLSACSAAASPAEPANSAIVILMDVSGSMAGPSLEAMKDACAAAAREIGPRDSLGILAFNSRPRWIARLGPEGGNIAEAVGLVNAEGASDLHAALGEALRGFRSNVPAGSRKRVIVLSDGEAKPEELKTAVTELVDEGAVVSAICVGSTPKFDAALLVQIAAWGKGRSLFTAQTKNLPKLLVQEVRRALRE